MSNYTKIRAEDESVENFQGMFFKLRRALDTNAFGINEIRLPADTPGREHTESETGHEEVYVALEGSGTCTIDGEDVELEAGDYLRIDPDATRVIKAGPNGLRFLAIAARPKDAYDGRESL